MGLSLMGGIPSAVAADRATDPARTAAVAAGTTGTIQATIRMDYPITPDKMAQSGGTVTLYRGTAAIAEGSLSKDGAALTFTDGSTAVGSVTWRTEEQRLLYIDLSISGLSAEAGENQYRLQFTADGFRTYTSEVLSLSNYSQGLILGTGDATFTQGDINRDGCVDSADVELVKAGLDT